MLDASAVMRRTVALCETVHCTHRAEFQVYQPDRSSSRLKRGWKGGDRKQRRL